MPSTLRLAFTLIALLLGTIDSSHAIVRRHDRKEKLYKELAAEPQFDPVGLIEVKRGGRYIPLGSATLIGSNRIMSAAHVLDPLTLIGAKGLRFRLGDTKIPISLSDPSAINLHPDYIAEMFWNDIAIAFLDQESTVTPASLYSGLITRKTEFTMVGYGKTGTGKHGSSQRRIAKRAAQNSIDRYISRTRFESDFDSPLSASYSSLGNTTPLDLEGTIGPGDSGGSAWILSDHGWTLIGVNTYGLDSDNRNPLDGYGDIAGFTYTSEYLDWIQSFGDVSIIYGESPLEAALSGSISVSMVPEPSILLLLGSAGALAAAFAFRSKALPGLGA